MAEYEGTTDSSPLTRAERRARAMFQRGGAAVGNIVAGSICWALVASLASWRGTLTGDAALFAIVGIVMMLQHARTVHGYNQLLERYNAELRHLRPEHHARFGVRLS